LPEHTLDILPGPNGETSAPAASSDNGTDLFPASGQPVPRGGSGLARLPWAWLSLALGVLWLGTLLAWWRARRAAPAKAVAVQPAPSRPAAKVQAAEARKAFRQACRANAAAAARKHLLAWAQTTWPDAPPAGLGDLAQRLGNPGLAQLLRALDRACYAGEDWHGAALLRALETLPGTEKNSHQAATLPGLYP
jgi:hypothetical protein